jgi:hypothetical protein
MARWLLYTVEQTEVNAMTRFGQIILQKLEIFLKINIILFYLHKLHFLFMHVVKFVCNIVGENIFKFVTLTPVIEQAQVGPTTVDKYLHSANKLFWI